MTRLYWSLEARACKLCCIKITIVLFNNLRKSLLFIFSYFDHWNSPISINKSRFPQGFQKRIPSNHSQFIRWMRQLSIRVVLRYTLTIPDYIRNSSDNCSMCWLVTSIPHCPGPVKLPWRKTEQTTKEIEAFELQLLDKLQRPVQDLKGKQQRFKAMYITRVSFYTLSVS